MSDVEATWARLPSILPLSDGVNDRVHMNGCSNASGHQLEAMWLGDGGAASSTTA